MLFTSLIFILFFPFTTAGFFLLPQRFQMTWLLFMSILFYGAFIPEYLLVLFFLIIVDYTCAIAMEVANGSRKKIWFFSSLGSTLLMLFFFKYFDFFSTNVNVLAEALHWNYSLPLLKLLLPLGLSFHTFQSLSYVIEVYRGNFKAERNFLVYSLYVMFYPQLVAGPIERPANLIPQFHATHHFDFERLKEGLLLMLVGFFKKAVIADRLAILVESVYSHPEDYSGSALLLATIAFSFQILCDFSGYSDIARGAARTMGFSLMENFHFPYRATSIREFWQRWHISLSTWLRDYIYMPLGGNHGGVRFFARNILLTFLISGLWHGANWTFVLWGLFHGLFLIIGRVKKRDPSTPPRLADSHRLGQQFITFSLVTLLWVFFRAENLADASIIFKKIFSFSTFFEGFAFSLHSPEVVFSLPFLELAIAPVALMVLFFVQKESLQSPRFRWGLSYFLVLSIFIFGIFRGSSFIYFQF